MLGAPDDDAGGVGMVAFVHFEGLPARLWWSGHDECPVDMAFERA